MKTLILLTAAAIQLAAAQTHTAIAVFSPTLGVRIYPDMDIARTVAPIEARMACRIPGALPTCEALSSVLHFGVSVTAISTDPTVRAFELVIKFSKDGAKQEHVDFIRNTSGGGASKIIWLGQESISEVHLTALKAAN